jgi:dUTPase
MSQLSSSIHQPFLSQLLNKYDKVMHLKIFITGSNNLKNMYYAAVNKHNNSLLNNRFIDAGFDLFLPEHDDPNECDKWGDSVRFFGTGWDVSPVNKIDFKVKCSAQMICDSGKIFNTGYYMYPRSSLSKTKLRLANSVGIIDAGYRGNLIGMFDVVNVNETEKDRDREYDYYAKVNDRLLQICAPSLVPIYVEIIEDIYELDISTERGDGGFGSTGN